MNNQLGAHEMLEVHEVLQSTIDGINLFTLYQPLVKDTDLAQLLNHQLGFMRHEYNKFVSNFGSITESVRSYGVNTNVNPVYGIRTPAPQQPNMNPTQIDDRDIAAGMLGFHKRGAKMKLNAALECADPELKVMLVESSNNCVYQAFDVWTYMNKRGMYQVPTFTNDVSNTMLGMYEPVTGPFGSRYLMQNR
ncbi:spore coat protein [Fredinandcohnia humi]